MSDLLAQVQAFFAEVFRRFTHVINFQGMNNKLWLRCIMVVCTYLLVRPWLVKLGSKVAESELGKMEARDKERIEAQQQKEAVNALRGAKPAANEIGTTTATEAEGQGADSLQERAKYRAQRAAEIQQIMAADKRAAELENWDEDDEFLKNFAQSSDRSHAKKS